MNILQKNMFKIAAVNVRYIRVTIGYDAVRKILRVLEREERELRNWGAEWKKYHPHAPCVANCAILELSRLWEEYAINKRELLRCDIHRIRQSHILVWSVCDGLICEGFQIGDFDSCTFISGKAE